jgi:RhtB (resistance to homoserine/threonine) family protein
MVYLSAILTVAGIHLLAVMSPGPDFVLIAKNSLAHSRKSGMYSALGLGMGILTHVIYCLAGLGFLISKSILIFNTIKILGALYLIYIGFKALTSKSPTGEIEVGDTQDLSRWASFRMGYITNITNPKATLFVLSLFTLVISPSTPLAVKIIMGLEMATVTALWFSLVSYIVSHPRVKKPFAKVQHKLEQVMGGILMLLGLKVAFLSSK